MHLIIMILGDAPDYHDPRWCTWHLTWTRRPTTWLPMSFFQTCRTMAWYLIQITRRRPFRYQNWSQNENNSCWIIFIITFWPNIRISLDNPYKSGWREEFYSLLSWIGVETVSIILCHQPLFYSEIHNELKYRYNMKRGHRVRERFHN